MMKGEHMSQISTSMRAQQITEERVDTVRFQTNWLFALLLILQLAATIITAIVYTPKAWAGSFAQPHAHLYAAIGIGTMLTVVPLYLIARFPKRYSTQITVSIAQGLYSALLIHLSGGRIETHFHIFGSLALLSFYRDWKTLIPATVVVAADHFGRGMFWPQSVFGVQAASSYRALEHALWVVFIDMFLIYSCIRGRQDISDMARVQAGLENSATETEKEVQVRTAELAESESFFRTILDSQSALLAIIDDQGVVIGTNSAWDTFWADTEGYGQISEGANYLDVCDEFDDSKKEGALKVASAIRSVLYGDSEQESVVYSWEDQNGKRWFRADVTSLFTSKSGAVIAHHDITEQIQKNIQLEQTYSELSRLALVAERTDNVVVITDRSGNIEWVNDGFTRLTDYSLNEVIGKKHGTFLNGPATNPDTIEEMRLGLENGSGYSVEVINYDKAGEPYWIGMELTPVRDADGELERFIAVERDITREVILRQKLVAETELMDAILEAIPFQVYWKNDDLEFEGCNTAFAKYVGRESREEVIGSDEHQIGQLPPDSIDAFVEDATVMRTGEPIIDDNRTWVMPNGDTRDLLVSKIPLNDQNGNSTGVVGLFIDVTDRNQLENQLQQAQKLESIGQLAAGIAHEINTPAQYVGDNTRFLRDEFDGILKVIEKYASQLDISAPSKNWEERAKEIKETLEEVDYEFIREEIPQAIEQSLEGIERITTIVRAMKDFSHPGSSQKELVDLNQAIESTATVCSNKWKYAADLEFDFQYSMPHVPCFLGEFNQVILNLIVNAADAIAEQNAENGEKGKITVSTSIVGDDAVITVVDNGPGMPEKVQAKIFDPFFTTKVVGKGTGQGLAISQDVIVQKHGGSIDVQSKEGEGTTFTVRHPLSNTVVREEAA